MLDIQPLWLGQHSQAQGGLFGVSVQGQSLDKRVLAGPFQSGYSVILWLWSGWTHSPQLPSLHKEPVQVTRGHTSKAELR